MKATVISSFAEDVLISDYGIEVREGGPALFICNALKAAGVPCKVFSGKKASVEIDMKNERGRIKEVDEITFNSKEEPQFVLISTLLDEFQPRKIGEFCCLDLQGYVREKSDFGKKKPFDSEELGRFDIVKATSEEIQNIPETRIPEIKTLLITDGSNGFRVLQKGKEALSVKVKKIAAKDTIGAGDTLFSAFCLKYYQTDDIKKSAEFARRTTDKFLVSKNNIQETEERK